MNRPRILRRTPVPTPRTRFVGRERELEELAALLVDNERLLTITGPGGAGKTALALELARRQRARDGAIDVRFCDLSAARSADEMVAEVAGRLGVWLERSSAAEAGAQLACVIAAHGPIMIVLDNFEQLEPKAALTVGQWLSSTTARFLVTSREPLRVYGERCYPLGPLAPDEALDLFAVRGRASGARFDIEGPDRAAALEIVERLDRLPLAIELAAAKLRTMTPSEILAGLSSRFELLRSFHRDVEPRHASLACAIEWSWGLLGSVERETLAQCAVFAGGFDLEAAEAVLDVGANVRDALASLVERSLLRMEPTRDGAGTRFHVYESVREYAARELPAEVRQSLEDRHARFLVERAEAYTCAVPPNLDRLADDAANLVTIARHQAERSPALAVRALLAIDFLLTLRGPFRFLHDLVELAMDCARRAGDPTLLGRTLTIGAAERAASGDFAGAREHALAAITLCQDDPMALGRALRSFARLEHIEGHLAEADALYARALDAARECGDARTIALTMADRGDLRGRPDLLRDALATLVWLGDRYSEAYVLWNLGRMERDLGHDTEACVHLSRALALARELGAGRLEALVVGTLAAAHHLAGRAAEARKAYRLAIDLQRDAANPMMHASVLVQRAALALEDEHAADAEQHLIEALAVARAANSKRAEALSLAYLGALAASRTLHDEARRCFDAARSAIDPADAETSWTVFVLEHTLVALAAPSQERRSILGHAAPHSAGACMEHRPQWPSTKLALRVVEAVIARADAREQAGCEHLPSARRAPSLVVATDAAWFRIEGGEPVDLSRRDPLRRVLARLVEAREVAPTRAVSSADLIAAGWPGERMSVSSARNRLRNAIATLRHMGLRDVLMTRSDGYLLDPDRALRRETHATHRNFNPR